MASTGYRFEPTFGATTPSTYFDYAMPSTSSKTYNSIFNRPELMMMTPPSPVVERTSMPTSMPFYGYPSNTMPLEYTNDYYMNRMYSSPMMPTMPSMMMMMMTPYERMAFERTLPYYNNYLNNNSINWMMPTMPTTNFESRMMMPSWNLPTRWPATMPTEMLPAVNNSWWCNSFSTVGSRPCNPIELYCLTNPIRVLDRDGNREIFLCFDLRGYKPEEVNVTFNKTERSITVEACHDVKEGKEHHVTRKYFRKFIFPESLIKVDLSKCDVKSWFDREGLLNVECPLPKMTNEEIAKCPATSEYFRNPYLRETVCPSTLPVNTKPVTVKMC